MARYSNENERGRIANIGNNLQGGTYANKYGDVGLFVDNGPRNLASAGYSMADDGTMNIGARMPFAAKQNYYNEIDTPLGLFAYGTNAPSMMNPGQAYADFTPRGQANQYYIQALANLLAGHV